MKVNGINMNLNFGIICDKNGAKIAKSEETKILTSLLEQKMSNVNHNSLLIGSGMNSVSTQELNVLNSNMN